MSLLLMPVPLFNKQMAVEAYLFRYLANESDYIAGYSPVLEALRLVGPDAFAADHALLVPVGARVLLSEDFLFSTDRVSFLLEDDVRPEEPYLTQVARLHGRGFKVGVQGPFVHKKLLRSVSYQMVDFRTVEREDPRAYHRQMLRDNGVTVIAAHIPSAEAYKRAVEEEYGLFEGKFYAEPITAGNHKISPLKVNLIRLLNVVRDNNFEFSVVAEIVQGDPALSLSLMRFINSPFIGVRHRVKTIQHAVTLLGQEEVRKWVTAAVFKSLGADKPGELTRLSLIRAKMAEALAPLFGMGRDAQSLFLMGLFSLIDSILGVDMRKAMEMVLVSGEISSALVYGEGRFFPVLSFMRQYEKADWKTVLRYCDLYKLTMEDVYEAYMQALTWYNSLISENVRPRR